MPSYGIIGWTVNWVYRYVIPTGLIYIEFKFQKLVDNRKIVYPYFIPKGINLH